MCDIVDIACYSCGVMIDCHLGDFSVASANVRPFCHKPECRRNAMQTLLGAAGATIGHDGIERTFEGDESDEEFIVFSSVPRSNEVYEGADVNKAVLFLVERPHDVSVNG